ncbi:hypothetical protein HT031_006701 [Scenedesmus sp. PABB004]|nr:hypothetical protein HT031_006701 [Scenedesmus sp. PABB004]
MRAAAQASFGLALIALALLLSPQARHEVGRARRALHAWVDPAPATARAPRSGVWRSDALLDAVQAHMRRAAGGGGGDYTTAGRGLVSYATADDALAGQGWRLRAALFVELLAPRWTALLPRGAGGGIAPGLRVLRLAAADLPTVAPLAGAERPDLGAALVCSSPALRITGQPQRAANCSVWPAGSAGAPPAGPPLAVWVVLPSGAGPLPAPAGGDATAAEAAAAAALPPLGGDGPPPRWPLGDAVDAWVLLPHAPVLRLLPAMAPGVVQAMWAHAAALYCCTDLVFLLRAVLRLRAQVLQAAAPHARGGWSVVACAAPAVLELGGMLACRTVASAALAGGAVVALHLALRAAQGAADAWGEPALRVAAALAVVLRGADAAPSSAARLAAQCALAGAAALAAAALGARAQRMQLSGAARAASLAAAGAALAAGTALVSAAAGGAKARLLWAAGVRGGAAGAGGPAPVGAAAAALAAALVRWRPALLAAHAVCADALLLSVGRLVWELHAPAAAALRPRRRGARTRAAAAAAAAAAGNERVHAQVFIPAATDLPAAADALRALADDLEGLAGAGGAALGWLAGGAPRPAARAALGEHWPPPLEVPFDVDELGPGDAVPRGFICAITQDLMRQPALLISSTMPVPASYERDAIARWLEGSRRDPKSRVVLGPDAQLVPNIDLQRAIEDWVAGVAAKQRAQQLAQQQAQREPAAAEAAEGGGAARAAPARSGSAGGPGGSSSSLLAAAVRAGAGWAAGQRRSARRACAEAADAGAPLLSDEDEAEGPRRRPPRRRARGAEPAAN